jgi:hypothetical protein
LLSCTGAPPPGVGKVWPTRDFFARPSATFSGFPASRLVSMDGGIPWRTSEYEAVPAVTDSGWSLAVQPAFQSGEVAAYVVTEIWDTHPDPWIQPVYQVHHNGMVNGVFGVGVDSTFYSPYWRIYDAQQTTQEGPFVSVADIVNQQLPLTKGPIWVCPIVPSEVTGYAKGSDGKAVRPFTHEEVTPPEVGLAWADGTVVGYLNFGERQVGQLYEGEDGTVEPDDLYVFTRADADGRRTPLELPAVMADEAQVHAYVRRVDVVLQGEAVFVPAEKGPLHDKVVAFLGDAGFVPVDPGVTEPLASKYTLRVASTFGCFQDGGVFPDDCEWLDSESAIDELPPSRVLDTDVTLTATPVLLGGKKL